MSDQSSAADAAVTLADLRLPPSFVTDHLIRTLSYQGAMSVVDIAKHLHVHADVVAQVVEPLKATGLLESESSRTNFEALNKVRLSSAGQARVTSARTRTWYAGPLPVALEDLETQLGAAAFALDGELLTKEMAPFFFDDVVAGQIGQAVAAASTLCLVGLAYDEQRAFASAIARALPGEMRMPYAVYAAGNVIRTLDSRVHVRARGVEQSDGARERGSRSPWAAISRPAVVISGAVLSTDILPAYDEDARFYLAPAPFSAFGGVMAFCDAQQSDREVLRDMARLWLAPGRHGRGVLLLRSGERIEVPWRAATVVMSETEATADLLNASVAYVIDAADLRGRPLQAFMTQRLPNGGTFPESLVARLCEMLESAQMSTRVAGAHAARYLRDRHAYVGASFHADDEVLRMAVQHAAGATRRPATRLQAAA